ncbi:hypothetical protein POTOM_018100 [Populus tomentosa]|uniref:Protein FAR1-RELATED SEQUENCE n=1 Tax=Populus tomentosa TaxID=118781 RepID=A0A8X7ZYL3_POPTO|nr:hypothetical protein POTOM_018100 [Populus tomentosa]
MASKSEDDGESITYQVAKFGEDHKAYHVKFNVLEMKATCSCQMFEFSGLLCRHVLTVFRVTNVLTLPSQRPTDVYTGYLESHTVRYNTLRHEAFKFVEEGSKSLDTYNVAMGVLQEATTRVAQATKNDGRAGDVNWPFSSRYPLHGVTTLQEDMDKKIQELRDELEYANRKCESLPS